ncbi:restriction endonuclease [Marinobacterium aestuariivivens]|uniref:Restriction endonuclease n=1 Tax=Marinobacterium aestuariivivens TaxID=1698799 RepID=A0ABW2A9E6_9GAMM
MARNRRASVINDLVHIASRLPSWASLASALISYLVLHHFADRPVQVATKPGSALPTNMADILFQPLLNVLQYAIPMAFLFGALISAVKAFSGRRLAKQYLVTPAGQNNVSKPAESHHGTENMSWQQFELLVGQAFRQAGYSVVDGGEQGPDGGVDVHLKKDGQTFLVQCKHWRARSVGVSVVRELYGVMTAAGAKGGFVVTSGDFTEEARAFANGKRISLIDGAKLDTMLRKAAQSVPEDALKPSEIHSEIVLCPRCSSPMVKRRARQGANVGQEFWGCSRFPQCRGIRN